MEGFARDQAAAAALRAQWSVPIPPGFVPYDETEVTRVRRPPLTDVQGARRRLVEEMEALGRIGP